MLIFAPLNATINNLLNIFSESKKYKILDAEIYPKSVKRKKTLVLINYFKNNLANHFL